MVSIFKRLDWELSVEIKPLNEELITIKVICDEVNEITLDKAEFIQLITELQELADKMIEP